MDPNATLELIRSLVSDQIDSDYDPARELAELVDSLDEWLSKGGFLPAAWTRHEDTITYTLAEVRNGTGWPKGIRFQVAP